MVTTAGDILYATAADTLTRLGIGTAGQVLKVNSGGTAPEWGAAASGTTFSGCSVFNSTTINHSSGAELIYTFNSENFDVDSYHSTSSNTGRLTIPTGKTGYFLVTGIIQWASNSTGTRMVTIEANGYDDRYQVELGASASQETTINISHILYLTATDYIQLKLFQNSGNTLAITAGTVNNNFSIAYLGA